MVFLPDVLEWWSSQGPSEVVAFKGGVHSARMPRAIPVEGLLEAFLRVRIFLPQVGLSIIASGASGLRFRVELE
jgi:hypothetical protein